MYERKLSEVALLTHKVYEAGLLILRLPCRCLNMGDGEYIECDRCRWLHGTENSGTGGNNG
jgi:hypothetical protein